MTWEQFRAARLVLAEQRLGKRIRADAEREDAAFDAAADALRKLDRR